MLFPTSLVGSYPQPDWLIDKARLIERVPFQHYVTALRALHPLGRLKGVELLDKLLKEEAAPMQAVVTA